MRKIPLRRTRAAVVAGLVFPSAVVAAAAYADPGPQGSTQAQVAQAKAAAGAAAAQVAALDQAYLAASLDLERIQEDAAAAGEEYNGALYRLQQSTKEAETAAAAAATARRQAAGATATIRDFASKAYQSGGSLGDVSALLSGDGGQGLLDRATALELISARRTEALAEAALAANTAAAAQAAADRASGQLAQAVRDAQAAKGVADNQAATAAAAAARIQTQQQAMAQQLATLRHTSVALEKARQDALLAKARQDEAKKAKDKVTPPPRPTSTTPAAPRPSTPAPSTISPKPSTSSPKPSTSSPKPTTPKPTTPKPSTTTPKPKPTTSSPKPPPPATGVAAVLAYANAQIGKWYQWGGAGPNTFDCSGLTMMAWRQAGVYLSHYTGAQWNETRRVAIADLQPGDLVFFGPSGPTSTHVGLYIGGGQMIEAPHTGAQVRIASIYRSNLLPQGGRP